MEAHDGRHVLLPLPVPRHDGRAGRRQLSALLLVALLAGCTTPPDEEETPLEAATIEGSIAIGDAFVLRDVRLSVAPANQAAEGTPGRAVPLAEPPWTARTALLRDHWVLEASLRERAPGSASGLHRIRLDWNGELIGAVHVQGANATAVPLSVVARFDVGPTLSRSNVYAFEITRLS